MKAFLSIVHLFRPVNCILAAIGVWVGAYMTFMPYEIDSLVFAVSSAILICAGGNLHNDYIDVEIDRISHPKRALVIGVITKQTVLQLAIGCFLVGIMLAIVVDLRLALLALLVVALLLSYNIWWKRMPLAGNVVIALLAGLTFLTGDMAVDGKITYGLPGPMVGAIYALLFHLVREIVKDVQDIEGDRTIGVNTLPQVIGVRPALMLALLLFFLLTILTFYPIWEGWFGAWYKIVVVYIVDLPLLLLLILIWGNPTGRMLSVGSFALKIGMALGLVALVVA